MSDAGLFDPVIDRRAARRGQPPRVDRAGHRAARRARPPGRLGRRHVPDRGARRCCRSTSGWEWTGACSPARAAMAAGVMNILPWGGPTLRAAAALKLPVTDVFNPLLPALAVGLVYVLARGLLRSGRREERRLARDRGQARARSTPSRRELTRRASAAAAPAAASGSTLALTLAVLGDDGLGPGPAGRRVHGRRPPWRCSSTTRTSRSSGERVDAHARAALMMASILLAAGVLTGIMQGSGMLTAMARRRGRPRARGARAARPGRARPRRDAAQPAVRPRLVLLRRAAGRRRGLRPARRRRRSTWRRARCSAR